MERKNQKYAKIDKHVRMKYVSKNEKNEAKKIKRGRQEEDRGG